MINIKFEKIDRNVHGFFEEWYFLDSQGCFEGPMDTILDFLIPFVDPLFAKH